MGEDSPVGTCVRAHVGLSKWRARASKHFPCQQGLRPLDISLAYEAVLGIIFAYTLLLGLTAPLGHDSLVASEHLGLRAEGLREKRLDRRKCQTKTNLTAKIG